MRNSGLSLFSTDPDLTAKTKGNTKITSVKVVFADMINSILTIVINHKFYEKF